MPWITQLLALINSLVVDRTRLALENIALREQTIVLRRSVKRAKIIAAGKLEKAVVVKGIAVTPGARAAIEAAGGKVETG